MRLRLSFLLVSVAILVALSTTFCSPAERTSIAAAQWFVMGPTDSTIAVGTPDRKLRIVDGRTGIEREGSQFTPDAGAVDVVFRSTGEMYVVAGRMRTQSIVTITKFADGKYQPVVAHPLPLDRELVPCLRGTADSGVVASESLILVERDVTGVRGLWCLSFADGTLRPIETEVAITGVAQVSVSPRGSMFAWIRSGDEGKRHDLEVLDFTGRILARHPAVEPIAPYWLEDVDALLFVRKGGGIARLSVDGGVVQSICDGSLTSGLARGDVAPRVKDSANVNIEKYSFQGFAQVFEISPFPLGGSGEKRITSDDIDNYGSAWSVNRRFLSYRQCSLGKATDPVVETLVAVDTENAYASTMLGERAVPRASNRVGPTFGPVSHRVYFVKDDQLFRVELAPTDD